MLRSTPISGSRNLSIGAGKRVGMAFRNTPRDVPVRLGLRHPWLRTVSESHPHPLAHTSCFHWPNSKVGWSGPVGSSKTLRSHGWPSRAYMDVFTACFGRTYRPRPLHQKLKPEQEKKTAMTVETNKETLGFQTEVKQLLHLMIHSLYSNKEIFLRELISNASDAEYKLRFAALKDDKLYEGDSDLKIRLDYDKDAGTITITDNGIGMNRDDVIANLGTIARSGTAEFLQQLTGDQKKDSGLIGQFGVGFYSAFIVADEVMVETRKAGVTAEEGVRWTSKGDGEFTVETINKPGRGTQITLTLKDDAKEYANGYRLRNIIQKYSDHIGLPIQLQKDVEVEGGEAEAADQATAIEWETINKANALWTRSKNEIKDEEYQEFYKHVAHDFEEPLAWSHNKVEGKQEYTSLLYIPKRAPFDLYQREVPRGLKLYVQRVFILDNAEQFLPLYLRFIKGVVDSSDLPLNISREIF